MKIGLRVLSRNPCVSLNDGREARSAVENGGDSTRVRKAIDNIRSTQSRLPEKEGSSKFRSGTNRISP
jgi:hypothetical protein